MADSFQIKAILGGSEYWNFWRRQNPNISIDLSNSNLSGLDLKGVNLSNANLSKCNLSKAQLYKADFSLSNLNEANFSQANINRCMFFNAKLKKTNLTSARIMMSDFTKADLSGATISEGCLDLSVFVETNVERAILNDCSIYGISVWNLKGKFLTQTNLKITTINEIEVTVDDLQVAQFIYLLLNRDNLSNVLNSITSKAVLILGRFTPERKMILDAIANELRKYNLLPIIFDFQKPTSRDFTETIKTLAGISLFVIADITSPKSSPLELQATVPDYQIPFVPIIQEGEEPFSMLNDLIGKYEWVLQPVIKYSSIDDLLLGFKRAILERAWNKHQKLQINKIAIVKTQSINDFINS